MSDDAVKVYCNMTAGGETCVFPDMHASRMPNIPWRKSQEGWYSTLRGGFKISYDSLGPVQMTFLRLMSTEAYQNFTYTCINSAAWYDARSSNYNNAIKLLGENEDEFTAGTNKPLVLHDGCKVAEFSFAPNTTLAVYIATRLDRTTILGGSSPNFRSFSADAWLMVPHPAFFRPHVYGCRLFPPIFRLFSA